MRTRCLIVYCRARAHIHIHTPTYTHIHAPTYTCTEIPLSGLEMPLCVVLFNSRTWKICVNVYQHASRHLMKTSQNTLDKDFMIWKLSGHDSFDLCDLGYRTLSRYWHTLWKGNKTINTIIIELFFISSLKQILGIIVIWRYKISIYVNIEDMFL